MVIEPSLERIERNFDVRIPDGQFPSLHTIIEVTYGCSKMNNVNFSEEIVIIKYLEGKRRGLKNRTFGFRVSDLKYDEIKRLGGIESEIPKEILSFLRNKLPDYVRRIIPK